VIKLIFQTGSALLDACVLAVLSRGEVYGYVLTQDIKNVIDVSESTLYPVLRRLQKDGLLTAFDRSFSGRNRRYYVMTEEGGKTLQIYRNEWSDYKKVIDQILSEGGEEA